MNFKEPKKILIGIPCYSGRVVVETVAPMVRAIVYHVSKYPHHEIQLCFRVRNFVTYAAEKLSELSQGFDYLLFWGDDIVPPMDAIERLMSHDKDMVASAVFSRGAPYGFYAYDDDLNMFHMKRLNTGLQKCRAAGTGLMLIKSSVFSKLQRPWWRWPDGDTDCDKEFCIRAFKEAGIETYVDTDLEVDHLDFSVRAINSKTHASYMKAVQASGILQRDEVRSHKDFKILEALLIEGG